MTKPPRNQFAWWYVRMGLRLTPYQRITNPQFPEYKNWSIMDEQIRKEQDVDELPSRKSSQGDPKCYSSF